MKADIYTGFSGTHLELIAAADTAAHAIPPMWPLSATVAVNPFLGQTEEPLPHVAARLERVAGTAVTQPRAQLRKQIEEGLITKDDLRDALAEAPAGAPASTDDLLAAARAPAPTPEPLPTVAQLASEASGTDWPALLTDRIGVWAAGYFDEGQALWSPAPGLGAFESWQVFAARDLSPEIAGLTGFTTRVAQLPQPARRSLSQACDVLGIKPEAASTYFHQLLLELGGWAQLARRSLFDAEMQGEGDATVTDLLTLRLVWEAALFEHLQDEIAEAWAHTRARHAEPIQPAPHHLIDCILQDAAERAHQRRLGAQFTAATEDEPVARPKLQAAFCIDVRSERFRRALEAQDSGISTHGFAGFFGLGAAHRDAASDVEEHRLPVLLSPQFKSANDDPEADSKRLLARATRAWGRFRQAAVSSFAFVEATGPLYAGKLLGASWPQPGKQTQDQMPRLSDAVDLPSRVAMAKTILHAMSLTEGFAPLVLILGHGAHVTNNAHASALQCGACGGYAGDVNARLLAGLLNDEAVRGALREEGLYIPEDTRFLAGLHDTTSDRVTLYADDLATPLPASDQTMVWGWLEAAGQQCALERSAQLSRATDAAAVMKRALDWSEVRPEWGLAGCSAFVAAPRHRTRATKLDGRAFLHDYDWQQDEGFGTLELILTAPVVVASWISLAYYGAVVAPKVFGGGNKLLHNVCGGVGTLEGNGGALRAGLPWQSVHDGTEFQHEALRLSVIVEAPAEAISGVLDAHPLVRALFDNRWLHLFVMDDEGRLSQRYKGDLTWEPVGDLPEHRQTSETAQGASAA